MKKYWNVYVADCQNDFISEDIQVSNYVVFVYPSFAKTIEMVTEFSMSGKFVAIEYVEEENDND